MKLNPFRKMSNWRRWVFGILVGFGCGLVAVYLTHAGMEYTSTNEYCESCHVHPHATESWEQGPHFKTTSGVVANCVDCHLPPEGLEHYIEKGKAGARDIYGYYFKDISAIDWDALSTLDHARTYTFDSGCSSCHVELFPRELETKAVDAHLHYQKNKDELELRCINCHLDTGHFQEEPVMVDTGMDSDVEEVREFAPLLTDLPPGSLEEYTEMIPGTDVKFEMVPIEGGTFTIGSAQPVEPDEGPQRPVTVSSFWMGKFEVTWDEWEAFYAATATRGKNEQGEMSADAMTGPTPPYGSPDQGWGRGMRPAITMTHFAAQRYCEWLSQVTGRSYRLPTEAEWEYAVRAGTDTPYFFQEEESPSWLDQWYAKIFGAAVDAEQLQQYAWYQENSGLRTHLPSTTEANPWGLYNMLGNVKEFCLDWYDASIYATYPEDQPVVDPRGPASGEERVVRGGSFKSGPEELRSAARDYTEHDRWLRTDPQSPKSVWWYSDSNDVGFRIVREFSDAETPVNLEEQASRGDDLDGR